MSVVQGEQFLTVTPVHRQLANDSMAHEQNAV